MVFGKKAAAAVDICDSSLGWKKISSRRGHKCLCGMGLVYVTGFVALHSLFAACAVSNERMQLDSPVKKIPASNMSLSSTLPRLPKPKLAKTTVNNVVYQPKNKFRAELMVSKASFAYVANMFYM